MGDHTIVFSQHALSTNDRYTNLFDVLHEMIHYITDETRHHEDPEHAVDDKAGLILMRLGIPLGRRALRLQVIEKPELRKFVRVD
jgi:hypothetical protein